MNAGDTDSREDQTAAICIEMVRHAIAHPADGEKMQRLFSQMIGSDAVTASDGQACVAIAVGFIATALDRHIADQGLLFLLRNSLGLLAKASQALERVTGVATAVYAGPEQPMH